MADEKVIPPNENEWNENVSMRKEKYFKGTTFSVLRAYANPEKLGEGLATLEIFDAGVVFKFLSIRQENKNKYRVYVLLSDGVWIMGSGAESYNFYYLVEQKEEGIFLRLTISLKTDKGVFRRIVRKKLEI